MNYKPYMIDMCNNIANNTRYKHMTKADFDKMPESTKTFFMDVFRNINSSNPNQQDGNEVDSNKNYWLK